MAQADALEKQVPRVTLSRFDACLSLHAQASLTCLRGQRYIIAFAVSSDNLAVLALRIPYDAPRSNALAFQVWSDLIAFLPSQLYL